MTYHQIIDDIFDYCVELLIIGARDRHDLRRNQCLVFYRV